MVTNGTIFLENGTIFWKNATCMYHFLEKCYQMVVILLENGTQEPFFGIMVTNDTILPLQPFFGIMVTNGDKW